MCAGVARSVCTWPPLCGLQDKDQQRSKSEGVGQSRLMAYAKMNGFLTSFIEKVGWTTDRGCGENTGERVGRVLVRM